MKIDETLSKGLRNTKTIFAVIATTVTVYVAIWRMTGEHSIAAIVVLALWVVLLLGLLIIQSVTYSEHLQKRGSETRSGSIELIPKEEDVKRKATELLENSKDSLYYYGGSGLIGDHEEWENELYKKLKEKEFRIVRLMDLSSSLEIEKMLNGVMPQEKIKEVIGKYKKWLKIHVERLEYSFENNELYDFEGAPCWKYGIHYMIFDKKNLLILFLTDGDKRKAILIRDNKEIVTPLLKSIEHVIKVLGLEKIKPEVLSKRINSVSKNDRGVTGD